MDPAEFDAAAAVPAWLTQQYREVDEGKKNGVYSAPEAERLKKQYKKMHLAAAKRMAAGKPGDPKRPRDDPSVQDVDADDAPTKTYKINRDYSAPKHREMCDVVVATGPDFNAAHQMLCMPRGRKGTESEKDGAAHYGLPLVEGGRPGGSAPGGGADAKCWVFQPDPTVQPDSSKPILVYLCKTDPQMDPSPCELRIPKGQKWFGLEQLKPVGYAGEEEFSVGTVLTLYDEATGAPPPADQAGGAGPSGNPSPVDPPGGTLSAKVAAYRKPQAADENVEVTQEAVEVCASIIQVSYRYQLCIRCVSYMYHEAGRSPSYQHVYHTCIMSRITPCILSRIRSCIRSCISKCVLRSRVQYGHPTGASVK